MASHHSRGNAVTGIAIGIVVSFVSVMGQSSQSIDCPPNAGCLRPLMPSQVSYVITKNVSDGYDSSNCFPIYTELLYVCREPEIYQFGPLLKQNDLFRKCTGSGWHDGNQNLQKSDSYSPNCVKREEHCRSLPAISSPNIFVEIQGRNLSTDNASPFYSVGTTATYKCKDFKLNANDSQRLWWCKIQNQTNYSWVPIHPNGTDPVCDVLSTEKPVDDNEDSNSVPTPSISENQNDQQIGRQNKPTPPDSDNSLLRNVIIGICSSLGFVLIAVLFCVLHKNRARLGKRYQDVANHPSQSPLYSIPEKKKKLEQNIDDGEENLQYVNIIPIAVNQETIYTEVETGEIAGKKSVPTVKWNIDDEQSTVYAKIHHSAISKDQRR